jgi:hypothetical protein
MPTQLEAMAKEKSTYVVTAAFTDEEGAAVSPTAITWTLTNGTGTVINDRSNVTVTPAPSVEIVLTNADLAIGTNGTKRVVTIKATYNSDAGTGLTLNDECEFLIADLLNVA